MLVKWFNRFMRAFVEPRVPRNDGMNEFENERARKESVRPVREKM